MVIDSGFMLCSLAVGENAMGAFCARPVIDANE